MNILRAALLLLKPLCIAAIPIIVATTMIKQTDVIWVVTISVVATVLAMTIFVNNFVQFESRFVAWFSHMTSSPRWFTVWILLMVLWIPTRRLLLEHNTMNVDQDFIVTTILWSCIPYMVENVLKSTTAKAMAILTELVISIKSEVDHSRERDELALERDTQAAQRDDIIIEVLNRVLDSIEARAEGGEAT
jgi:low affinity Fe/Cu permease